jgi:hypothetical protein
MDIQWANVIDIPEDNKNNVFIKGIFDQVK